MNNLSKEEARTYARIAAKRLVPARALDRLRAQSRRRRRGRQGELVQGAPATRGQLAGDLRALGLKPGEDVLIHSSLSAAGPIEGGVATLLAAISNVVGADATILAPAYPMPGTMLDWMTTDTVFDVATSPSCMGALTEQMRRMPGAERSAHPTHSIVAVGNCAKAYTQRHHLDGRAMGPQSPFFMHMQRGGRILCLGTGVGKVTSYHVIEDVVPGFPLAVHLQSPMSKTVVLGDGRRERVATLVHDPALSPWRVDNFKPKEDEILAALRAGGLVSEGRVGQAASHLIDAGRLFTAMQDWTRKGLTIYHRPRLLSARHWLGLFHW